MLAAALDAEVHAYLAELAHEQGRHRAFCARHLSGDNYVYM
jgi:hypothetical protein